MIIAVLMRYAEFSAFINHDDGLTKNRNISTYNCIGITNITINGLY